MLEIVKGIHGAYNYDGSEVMVDYFHRNYWGSADIESNFHRKFRLSEKATRSAKRAAKVSA